MTVKLYRRVILESPFAPRIGFPDDVERNKRYLEACMNDCLINYNDAPFASHKLYTDALDDTNPVERSIGIEAGFVWHGVSDATVVYTDFGISDGMRKGIANAELMEIDVEYRKLPKSHFN